MRNKRTTKGMENHRSAIRSWANIALAVLLLVVSFSVARPTTVRAAEEDCSEAELRGLGVAIINCAGDSANCSVPVFGGAGGSFGSAELLAFASLPITSTWNIPDSTAEQWFLQQAGARATIAKYGLNGGNIGSITAAIKGAGVSPAFFYAYTVNEGGGAGGFINHYGSDTSGGGVGNARRDAEYLANQSKIMNSQPAWIDAGNPVDFVPQEVKNSGNASFQSMPSGTIGRAYIPATAATTWEVYYPNGLKAEFNRVQNYGAPLNDTMKNIQRMGGDPTQGGSTVTPGMSSSDCPDGQSGVAGEGIEKAVNWAKMIAANDGYGYDQATRTSGWEKWQSNPDCNGQCGSFDCSSFVSAALTVGGYFETNPNFNTGSQPQALERAGFRRIATSATSSANLQAGDILISSNRHTAMYIGNNQIVETGHDENNQYRGGQPGDQTGDENKIRDFYNYPWDMVYRATK